jgi:hypothetical protein
MVEDAVGERLEVEADAAHPAGHQVAAEAHALPGVDRLLTVERQAIGVLGDRDLGEQRLRRKPRLDEPRRCGCLDHALAARRAGILRAARDDHPELCRNHVEAVRHVLADLHPRVRTAGTWRIFRFDDHLDPRQVARQRLARPRFPGRRLGCGGLQGPFDRGQTGLDLLEGEGALVGIERLRSPAEASSLQRL